MAITAGTSCCGKCGKWYFGYSCPDCSSSATNKKDETADYNFPQPERSELIDTSQTQIYK